jgi:hypothetical protein
MSFLFHSALLFLKFYLRINIFSTPVMASRYFQPESTILLPCFASIYFLYMACTQTPKQRNTIESYTPISIFCFCNSFHILNQLQTLLNAGPSYVTAHPAAAGGLASTSFKISICKNQIFYCFLPFCHIKIICKFYP